MKKMWIAFSAVTVMLTLGGCGAANNAANTVQNAVNNTGNAIQNTTNAVQNGVSNMTNNAM
ncbi:hypothetical protein [Alicyclobacillus ferrooxydans]|uniref:Circumsporozoite protein n=1 Tax=Alicyclobacillus ferrooxydans TaxID=471514 RepID=A0A0P9CRN5_9BACL|nr:hypothetical protein [Alicyclobacillus ferrooxydans]KPV42154.1 hypothetical protein AN477_19105 [Alicyclobacillus ferrooxydans]